MRAFFHISPKQVFLLDGIGASLTAISLGIVLPMFPAYVGLPTEVLLALGAAGILYALYSFSCFFFLRGDFTIWLKCLILANLLYCVGTAGVVTFYIEHLTMFGLLYFGLEVAIILGVVFLELSVLKKALSNQSQS